MNNENGVSGSDGVSESDGVSWSDGVYNCLFISKQRGVADMIFNKQTNKERAAQVIGLYREKLNGWRPRYNNAIKLYEASGREWKNVDASKIEEVNNKVAWEGMPTEAIDYLKSLPEWNAEIFKEITGIDVNQPKVEVLITVNGKEINEPMSIETAKRFGIVS